MGTFEEKLYEKIWRRSLADKSDFSCSRIEEAVNLLGKGNRLLDIGCGEGTFAVLAKEKFKHVFGIDFSIKALRKANIRNITVIKNNLNKVGISFQSDTFDMVTCLDVIEHVFEPEKLIQEAFRVLKNDGILILTTPNIRFVDHIRSLLFFGRFPQTSNDQCGYDGGHIHYFTFTDVKKLLLKAGFHIVKERGYDKKKLLITKDIFF